MRTRIARSKRVPCPFKVGDRVRNRFDGPGALAARNGTVVEVRDEWPTVGPVEAHQAVHVIFDAEGPFKLSEPRYRREAIMPWTAYEPAS